MASGRQPRQYATRAIIGPGQILPIDQRHDRNIRRADEAGMFVVFTRVDRRQGREGLPVTEKPRLPLSTKT
jgi:hypothetical protein